MFGVFLFKQFVNYVINISHRKRVFFTVYKNMMVHGFLLAPAFAPLNLVTTSVTSATGCHLFNCFVEIFQVEKKMISRYILHHRIHFICPYGNQVEKFFLCTYIFNLIIIFNITLVFNLLIYIIGKIVNIFL